MKSVIRSIYISSIIYACFPTHALSATDECDRYQNHMEQVQCISRNIKKLDTELNKTYQLALTSMPKNNNEDRRKEQEQLRKSQRSWLRYKDENCALIGGLEGGSNLWVTHFAANCEAETISERIKFLKDIANGNFKP